MTAPPHSPHDAPGAGAGEVRFAVVGAGYIGRHHAAVIGATPGMRLTAVVDGVPELAEALADQVEAETGQRPTAHADVAGALAGGGVDAVAVCVPSGLHADVAVTALEAGRHVVLEKPLEVTVGAGRRVAAAAAAAAPGALATVISQHRYDPASQVVHRAVAAGRLGRLTSAVASLSWWRGQGYYDSGGWRGTWALDGGGALMNQGVHTLDLLLWFMGRPVQVHAHTALLAHERVEVEDTVVATITFESGALAVLHATTAAYPGTSARLQVNGTAGSAIIDDDELLYFHAADAADGSTPVSDYGATGTSGPLNQAAAELATVPATGVAGVVSPLGGARMIEGQSRQYADVAACIRTGRPPLVTVDQALLALAAVRAVYRSAATGAPVLLDDVLADPDDVPGAPGGVARQPAGARS